MHRRTLIVGTLSLAPAGTRPAGAGKVVSFDRKAFAGGGPVDRALRPRAVVTRLQEARAYRE